MKPFFFFLFITFSFLLSPSSGQSNDEGFFVVLYSKISELMSPGGASNPSPGVVTSPKTVSLMELPGLAIAREDLDVNYWAANGFESRDPAAVFSAFVDRAPKYVDTTFVDSGSRISDIWKLFMTEYVVDPNDDPAQLAQVASAKAQLANSSLQQDFLDALDQFSAAQAAALQSRKQCFLDNPQDPEICGVSQVIPELRTSVLWFNMETKRRELLGAQATVLALQSSDLKSVFATALQNFQRSLRVDTGAAGYGSQFYATFATPSNWYTWWSVLPSSYDMTASGSPPTASMTFAACSSEGRPCYPALDSATAAVHTQPLNGQVVVDTGAQTVTYTANTGFVGADYFSLWGGSNDTIVQVAVGVKGTAAGGADAAAFASVACSASESTTSASSSYSSLNVGVSLRVKYGMVSVGASSQVGVSTGQSSFSASSTSNSVAFSVAKVAITRPWLDPMLLAYSPVGVKGFTPGSWSDGTGFPTQAATLKLPLLPTSFIVARDISITSTTVTAASSAFSKATSSDTTLSVSVGPFFSGSARVQTSSSNSRKHEESSTSSDTLTIPGPQVIGWVCLPLPRFPNTDYRDPVFAYKSST